jgi:hypothetical protein
MCTIGAIHNSRELIIFKNCDFEKKLLFYKPQKRKGKYHYLAFARNNRPGLWAGINQFGLGIVAADTYTKKTYKEGPHTTNGIFKGYEKTISDYKNVDEALGFLKDFYKNKIKVVPDLVMVADREKMAVLEFIPPNKFGIKIKKNGYLLRTNQFKMLKGGKNKNQDLESYIRFENALKKIKLGKSVNSIINLCRDHTSGPSKFSVCRHGKNNECKTQASAVMIAGAGVTVHYVINNFPCKKRYQIIKL